MMKKALLSAILLTTVASAQASCNDVAKLVAAKSLELSIIVNQKTEAMGKTVKELRDQNFKDIKAKRVSFDIQDQASELARENSELNHVNAVLGAEIGKLVKSNPKCFK